MEEQTQTIAPEPAKSPNIKGILILLVVILLVGSAVGVGLLQNNKNKQKQADQQQTEKTISLAPNTVVYGYWTEKNSVIESVDLSTGQNNILANLPTNVKNVKVLSNNKIAFIKDTDERDYGKEVVVHTIQGSDLTVAKADDGFGIDDYVISPDRKYFVTWELSPASNSQQVLGGRSRVYSVSLDNPDKKNIIFDEVSNPGTPVHYPIGVTNNGEIFMDKFLPNSGAGWAYGMSLSSFTGSVKSEINSMVNGSYGSQPIMSPDGSKIVFIGYDGSRGDGTADVNGFRRALVVPNTIEILDTATKTRTKLISEANGIYQGVKWDLLDGNIIYGVFDNKTDASRTYKYFFNTHSSKEIDLPAIANGVVKSSLGDGKLLIGQAVTSDSAIGNLGSKYEQFLSSISVFNPVTGKNEQVNLDGGYVQLIGIEGPGYFKKSNVGSSSNGNKGTAQGNQIQLETFVIKPTLAPKRIEQQSQPPQGGSSTPIDRGCSSDLVQQQCAGSDPNNTKDNCFLNTWTDADGTSGSCYRSPLYLYGHEGTSLNVSVGTPIYSVNTPYMPETGFAITLGKNGRFIANGAAVDSLSFDYISGIKKLSRPQYGVVVKGADLKNAIREYAAKLGLNEEETQDTVDFAVKNARSPYVYVSFYDNDLSKQILPLYFSIQPDSYHNIVFYLERLVAPIKQPASPVFKKIVRKGFTAIEVSFIVK